MKRLIVTSILCLATVALLCAQEKPHHELRLVDPSVMFPRLPSSGTLVSPNVWGVIQNLRQKQAHQIVQPGSLVLKGFVPSISGVCSVPLTDAHADAADPRIAKKPSDTAVPIRQAHLPAPPCKK